MEATENQLVRYDEMCRAIAECHAVDEVKDIRDKAMAMEHYAKQALNTDAERQAAEIRIRAERQCGKLLKTTQMDKGGRPSKNQSRDVTGLEDMGISRNQSSKWQKLAEPSDEEFETALTESPMPTTSGLIRKFKTDDPGVPVCGEGQSPVSKHSVWMWDQLNELEKFIADHKLSDLLDGMTNAMRERSNSVIPKLRRWLDES